MKLREEVELELLKLIEIVLLDKYGRLTTPQQRETLDARLKSLFEPRGKNENGKVIS